MKALKQTSLSFRVLQISVFTSNDPHLKHSAALVGSTGWKDEDRNDAYVPIK